MVNSTNFFIDKGRRLGKKEMNKEREKEIKKEREKEITRKLYILM